jgi:hypothetical protein
MFAEKEETMPPQKGQRLGGKEYLALGLVLIAFALLIFLIASTGCAAPFSVSSYHGATVLTGDRIHVEQECVRRRVPVYAAGENPWGCTDWDAGVIVTVDLPKVYRHEQCRWDHQDADYYTDQCPSPVVP